MQKLRADRLDAMGGMATALSHEINQPLGAAAIYLSAARRLLVRSFFKPSGVENALAKAADQVTRAGQIVGRMRSFVTRGEPDATAQSMYELAREAHELASGAGLSDVEVSIRLNARNDRVLADRIQIQQVLVNLMRNAMEAMSGSPKRRLTLSISATEADMVQTDVSDTGSGLPAQIRETLFEPFKTTKATGMGVGLSISRSIIEAHRGRLWAGSTQKGERSLASRCRRPSRTAATWADRPLGLMNLPEAEGKGRQARPAPGSQYGGRTNPVRIGSGRIRAARC